MTSNNRKLDHKGFAGAKRTTLLAQYRDARESLANLDSAVTNLLEGQNAIGGKALVAAYSFTIACMERSAEAAKLPGWKDAAVQPGANPYCQPLKLLAGDMDKIIQSRITIWAKVFADAHAAKIKPQDFLEHRKRNNGMRRWYDFINTSAKVNGTEANDNRPSGGSRKPAGCGGKEKRGPIDVAQRLNNASRAAVVVIDMAVLMNDAAAKASLESNPAFVGIVKAGDTKCRAFAQDNDARFTIVKGAA